MKKTSIGLFFMFIVAFASSQIVTVKDKKTMESLEMATLYVRQMNVHATTNAQGKADISRLKGAEKIEVRMLGFKTQVLSYSQIEALGFVILMQPSSLSMDEVVVSASRFSHISTELPNKVKTVSAKEMALQNPQTAADLLALSGGVFVQKSQQGGGSPMIRGFATNRLVYTVDGVRMNNAIFRSGNIQNVISLDPFAIEHAEVNFGPGSVMYGSDAIGGVMSFQTLTPQLSLNGETHISGKTVGRYSTANNEKTAHFDINVGWKKWAMLTSFSSNDYGDLKMGAYGPDEYLRPFFVKRIDSMDVVVKNDDPRVQRPSAYTQQNLMQKIRFKPNEKIDFQYGFHYSETSDYSRYDRHIRYKNGNPRYGEWSYGPQKWMMNNLNITHSVENFAYNEATLRVAHQFFEESRISRDINKNNRETRIEKVDAYSANLDFVKNINKNNKLYYGFEGVLNQVHSTGIDENIKTKVSKAGASRYPESDWTSLAFYLSDQHKISDKVLVIGGLRYNQFLINAAFDTTFYPFPFTQANLNYGSLSGSAGLVYRPSESWLFTTNLTRAFRAPNVDDIGKVFDSAPGIVVVPNPNLSSEFANNIDFSVAKMFGEKLKLEFTAYYTLLENALVRRDFTLNGMDSLVYDGEMSKVQAVQNAAKATVYGFQAGFDVKLPSGFGISSVFNYQIGEEELDDKTTSPSRHAAPYFGNSSVSYTSGKLNLMLYAHYSGAKTFEQLPFEEQSKTEIYAIDKNGKPWSPAWYTLNFKSMYQFAEHLSVSAGIENITDQRYRPYSSGIAAPGRNIVISLRASF